jgi:2-polyprenyl-3-methyl-5-hydroxy-6-metoxy-1,4-benzoquinol methylase
MDRLIKRFDAVVDSDLALCEARGVAYQRSMAKLVRYDEDYFRKVKTYDGTSIGQAVNAGRCALIARHLPIGSKVLDYGSGSGAFIRDADVAGFKTFGYDVMLEAVAWLEIRRKLSTDLNFFDAVTLWDTIEHLDMPEHLVLRHIRPNSYVFASIPVFEKNQGVEALSARRALVLLDSTGICQLDGFVRLSVAGGQ